MKITRYEAPTPRGPVPHAYDKAREAAIEKAKNQYIHLACKHFTTWESDELYSHWRPNSKVHWCEKCNKWKEREKPPKKEPLPDNPLF